MLKPTEDRETRTCFDCKFDGMCYVRLALDKLATEMSEPIINFDTTDSEELLSYFMESATYCHKYEEI